jgi:hypothetical protein
MLLLSATAAILTQKHPKPIIYKGFLATIHVLMVPNRRLGTALLDRIAGIQAAAPQAFRSNGHCWHDACC